jgi:acetylglutamate synthase
MNPSLAFNAGMPAKRGVPVSDETAPKRPVFKLGQHAQPMDERCLQDFTYHSTSYSFAIKRSFEGIDTARLQSLLESSFGKKLADSGAYFASPKIIGVIVEQDYLGCAIVKELDGHAYLDKLAVSPEKKKNGLGGALWKALTTEFQSFIWRCAKDNPTPGVHGWYADRSEGHQEHGEWVVYWHGMKNETAMGMVERVGELPKTLLASG